MTLKFYASSVVTTMSDVDRGNLADWTYTTENGQKILKTYKKNDWNNIVYVPKAGGTTAINSYNVQTYGAGYAPFYNMFNLKRVDLQKVPFKNNSMWFSFANCYNLTHVYNISSSIVNMTSTFSACIKFNQNIKIPNKVLTMNNTFSGCTNFNQNIAIANPKWVCNAFYGCIKFNQNIKFSEGTGDFSSTFYGCTNFNQNIKFPNSVTWMPRTFFGCTKLNQNIQIPKNVENMGYTFSNCKELSGRINILSTEVFNVRSCFNNTTKAKQVYIYYKYANGVYTKTYNTCFDSSYGINGRNGVTLYNLGTCPW